MKIEADKKKEEEQNKNLLNNLNKICQDEILIYEKENNDKDIFFNLDSDYYSSSFLNSDSTDVLKIKELNVNENDPVIKKINSTETNEYIINNENIHFVNINKDNSDIKTFTKMFKRSYTNNINEINYINNINNNIYNNYYYYDDLIYEHNLLNMDFMKNIKKMNEFYELLKKLKLLFKDNLNINSEWHKNNMTTIQLCCKKETKMFKEITNNLYFDVIQIEQQLNKNKKKLDIHTKIIMIFLSLNKIPPKWSMYFNKKIKYVNNFITYFENIKEQLYFWNITGELKFYNIQYLFYPTQFFKALLIKYSFIYQKKIKDCILICKTNNDSDINKKENVHTQKNIYYSSDEDIEFVSNQINYSNYVHYDMHIYTDIDIVGIYTLVAFKYNYINEYIYI